LKYQSHGKDPVAKNPRTRKYKTTLFSHEDKPENVEIIREEQDVSELHQEIKERLQKMDKDMEKVKRMEMKRLKETKKAQKKQTKKKATKKEVKRIEASSDEYEKLTDTEEEKEKNAEPPYNLNGETMEILRASWKNEMEIYEQRTIPRIMARHFKKIRNGLSLVMSRAAAIFRMINEANEED
jgi:hypothetical protein